MQADPYLKITPLGGLGHIGGNMLAVETESDLVVIDCGVLFPSEDQPGVDYIIPDATYVFERRDKLRAFLITHGHEDHIGALPFVIAQLPRPIYVTRFTRKLLELKFSEYPELQPDFVDMRDGEAFAVGTITVVPLAVTHSIPDAVALALHTPHGTVVHTGDFKLDPSPLDARPTDLAALQRLGDAGVAVLLSDSTNAGRAGWSWSEAEVAQTLQRLIGSAAQRVFVTTFSSHLHRLGAVIAASQASGRKVALLGRSMQHNVQLALENGLLHAGHGTVIDGTVIDALECRGLPPRGLTVIAGGCQGEPLSAMSRLAAGEVSGITIDPGDRVILSSRRIPGNERQVGTLVNNLLRRGAEVIDDRCERVHTSGHAFADEQQRIIEVCRPRFFIPVHGELRHLLAHAGLAERCGVEPRCIFVVEDGTPVLFEPRGGELIGVRGEAAAAGLVFLDGKQRRDVGSFVLRDRQLLGRNGIVACFVVLDAAGDLVAGPTIISRGVVHVDENRTLLEHAAHEVSLALLHIIKSRASEESLASESAADRHQALCDAAKASLRRFFRRELGRRPLVVPVILTPDAATVVAGASPAAPPAPPRRR